MRSGLSADQFQIQSLDRIAALKVQNEAGDRGVSGLLAGKVFLRRFNLSRENLRWSHPLLCTGRYPVQWL